MKLIEQYEHDFEEARVEYNEIMKGKNEASILLKWMIENYNTHIYLFDIRPKMWEDKLLYLQGLIEFYHQLYWCLYDDGSVLFLKTDRGGPVIYFDFDEFSEELPKEIPHKLWSDISLKVEGHCWDVWEFMETWEEKNKERIGRFSQPWISWRTYKQPSQNEN